MNLDAKGSTQQRFALTVFACEFLTLGVVVTFLACQAIFEWLFS